MKTWQRIHRFEGVAGRRTDFARLRTARTWYPLFSFKRGTSTAAPNAYTGIYFQYGTPRLCGNFSDVLVGRVTYAAGVFIPCASALYLPKRNAITESLLHINTNNYYWKLNKAQAVSASSISFYFHSSREKRMLTEYQHALWISSSETTDRFSQTLVRTLRN
jgi:hypothetical protein